MRYASLIVHLDLDRSNEARLRVARHLAALFGARLIGAAAADFEPMYFADGPAAQSFIDGERRDLERRLGILGTEFKAAGERMVWRQALTRPGKFLAGEAKAADLVICGAAPKGGLDETREVDPGRVVMQGGRPVLLVPEDAPPLDALRALVAWKDTREARRAVADALPLLLRAEKVVLASVSDGEEGAAHASAGLADVAAWFDLHGVAVQIRAEAARNVSASLRAMAAQERANVIVAGAYGHSRAQEAVFGGVTRDLIVNPPCALFLSH